jgi:cobalt/nickel transport system ATP-binding protein
MVNKFLYELKDVSYSYLDKYTALKDVSANIGDGERLALLGANGSGKSTLLLLLAGLVFPNKGIVSFMGNDLMEDKFLNPVFQKLFRSRVGMVFQNPDIQLFNSSVRDEIMFGLLQLGLPGDEMDRRFGESISLMAIKHLEDRHPQYLSIGEKKRVAIASVLAMEPDILLLDEPTAGLDPRTTRHLIDIINHLSEKGKTIITATQDIHIVSEIADRAIVLSEEKRLVKDGGIHDILADKELLQKHNLIHTHLHEHEGKPHVHPHEHPDHHHAHGE